ncbi:hypothetical protein A3A74_05500 [Candidatus Roizmanbacteria bacterium RIFCSPLOWO2_01_FULL_35_13]|uniref:Methyltransferase type 11 domain-containing protein n=1 Tax=Candidatus Roizmanbacteria bacterium RIFCSPLOWO2_01_FULL_35_13 TaxID=1802055 RepID=A0A1F7I971_9BACT|nr:MAG: hypothetical protein A3A74_05500 [Candidatus Roizmanbacteria bacterium RIFCSPLOWO2_01_FULL_35_13]
MKKRKYKFEGDYFEGYYKGIGDFSKTREKELRNWFKGILNYVNKFVPIKSGEKKEIIEFGCATGIVSKLLSKEGHHVLGTDISSYMIKKDKKLYPDINFRVQDMEKPLREKSNFDLVVAFDVIEHLENPKLGIKNAFRCLKKGGFIILSTCSDTPGISTDPSHINIKSPSKWKEILTQAGFHDIIVKRATVVPYLYRFHWRFSIVLPFKTGSPYIISPVFIFARK